LVLSRSANSLTTLFSNPDSVCGHTLYSLVLRRTLYRTNE